jgi:hypothetical protein
MEGTTYCPNTRNSEKRRESKLRRGLKSLRPLCLCLCKQHFRNQIRTFVLFWNQKIKPLRCQPLTTINSEFPQGGLLGRLSSEHWNTEVKHCAA